MNYSMVILQTCERAGASAWMKDGYLLLATQLQCLSLSKKEMVRFTSCPALNMAVLGGGGGGVEAVTNILSEILGKKVL